jgi:hypothetical protein
VLLLTGPSWPSEARAIRHRTPGRCAAASYSRWETRVSGTAYNPKRVESWVIFVYDPMVSTGVSLVEKQNRSGSLGTGRFAGFFKNRSVHPVFTGSIAWTVF